MVAQGNSGFLHCAVADRSGSGRNDKLEELQLCVAQAEGVGDDGDGTEAHSGGGKDGAEQQTEEWIKHASGNGNADGVIDEGEEKILADVAHGGAGSGCGRARFR